MSGKQTNKEEQRLAALRRLAIVEEYGVDWECMLKNARCAARLTLVEVRKE